MRKEQLIETMNNVDTFLNPLKSHLPKSIRLQLSCMKESFLTGANFQEPELIGTTNLNGKEIQLVCFDFALLCCGIFPGAKVAKVNNNYIIFVNTKWKNAPEYIKESILAHEIGHIELGHLETPTKERIILNVMRIFGFKSSTLIELEADEFAAQHGHGEGLTDLLKQLVNQGLVQKELKQRIIQLEKNN